MYRSGDNADQDCRMGRYITLLHKSYCVKQRANRQHFVIAMMEELGYGIELTCVERKQKYDKQT